MEKNKVSNLPERLSVSEADAQYGPAVTEGAALLAFNREMAELGDKMVAEVMAVFDDTGIDLDYTEESLEELDDLIDMIWADSPITEEEAVEAVVANWGAYFGLTILHNLGGEWVFRKDLEHTAVRFPRLSLEIFPLHKVKKRMMLGKEEHLYNFYERLVDELTAD